MTRPEHMLGVRRTLCTTGSIRSAAALPIAVSECVSFVCIYFVLFCCQTAVSRAGDEGSVYPPKREWREVI